MKAKIEGAKPELAVDRQKLIHAGKVLKDDQTVASLSISESDFIVCMVTKETAKPKIDTVPAAAPVAAPTTAATAPTSAPAASTTAPAAASPPVPASNAFVTNEAVESLTAMGFPEAETRAALAAAMGNPDMAYEFLLTGTTHPINPLLHALLIHSS